MQTILIVFHIFLAVGLVGLILIQHGKGADMGAAFGSGASGTVFGAKGSASFLTRLTAGLATLFFITSMVMAYFASQRDDGVDVLGGLQQPPAIEVEAQPQSDIPPVPTAGTTDMPPVVEEAVNEVPAAPADLPAVPQEATQADDVAPAEAKE
ncbi:MAG: preprotein translocase subunit SecG [Candidatus Thiodiazotropha sp. (ex Monitilora ramsayi)]|nr:preprotein translocase subunit SecG [Candidatus Thiodiazotropha sp. (ex Monitilora ramsayi)]